MKDGKWTLNKRQQHFTLKERQHLQEVMEKPAHPYVEECNQLIISYSAQISTPYRLKKTYTVLCIKTETLKVSQEKVGHIF